MKITVTCDGEILAATLPFRNCDHVVVGIACSCGSVNVRGSGIREKTHDTYIADAVCCGCGKQRGAIRAKVSTIFGIEEDERMLSSVARVY